MQCIHFRIFLSRLRGCLYNAIPLLSQRLEIHINVLLELANGFGAECVRDGLALARMFGTISCIEQAALDRDEGIVVFAVSGKNLNCPCLSRN